MRKILAAIVLLVAMTPACANVVEFCNSLGDYGITAAALAKQEAAGRVQAAVTDEILRDMYFPEEPPSPPVAELYERIRQQARASRMEPSVFASDLVRRCARARGDPAIFLGGPL